MIWLDDVRVSQFFFGFWFCFGFFLCLVLMLTLQIGCCLNCFDVMCDCGVKFVHATSMHFSFGPFERSAEEQRGNISTNYFQICPAISEFELEWWCHRLLKKRMFGFIYDVFFTWFHISCSCSLFFCSFDRLRYLRLIDPISMSIHSFNFWRIGLPFYLCLFVCYICCAWLT